MGSLNAGTAIGRAGPLITCDIAQLEEFFAVSRENVEALRDLQDELRYRQSPHALALLSQIHHILEAHEARLSCGGGIGGGGPDRSAGCPM